MVSLLYSMAGGILSTVIMIILKRMGINMIIVSIAGAVAHNAGQILVASILLETSGIWWYMLVLWFFGIISGFLIGILGSLIIKRIM
jgi:heptaprenyl diphosphate synthase